MFSVHYFVKGISRDETVTTAVPQCFFTSGKRYGWFLYRSPHYTCLAYTRQPARTLVTLLRVFLALH